LKDPAFFKAVHLRAAEHPKRAHRLPKIYPIVDDLGRVKTKIKSSATMLQPSIGLEVTNRPMES